MQQRPEFIRPETIERVAAQARINLLLMGVSGVLAAVGRQPKRAMYGLLSGITGLLVAGLLAIGTTWLLNHTYVIPPESNLVDKPLLVERVHPGWYTVITAFAAGVAGAVAMTKDKLDTLVGVTAALALVPAVAAVGISLLSGEWQLAQWGHGRRQRRINCAGEHHHATGGATGPRLCMSYREQSVIPTSPSQRRAGPTTRSLPPFAIRGSSINKLPAPRTLRRAARSAFDTVRRGDARFSSWKICHIP